MALTRRQKQVMDLIARFVDEHGYSPSYDEIAKGLGLASLATVHKHISALEAKSYLRRGHKNFSVGDVALPVLVAGKRPHPSLRFSALAFRTQTRSRLLWNAGA